MKDIEAAIADAGARMWLLPASDGEAQRLVVAVGERQLQFAIRRLARAPYPGEIARLADEHAALGTQGTPLLMSDHITVGTGKALTEAGWSWADRHGNMDLRGPGFVVSKRSAKRPARKPSTSLPLGGPASRKVIRWLAARPGQRWQTSALAHRLGVSPATVSQLMAKLCALGLAERVERGTWDVDSRALLERFLGDYAGPGGEDRYFYVAGSVASAALSLFAAQSDADDPTRIVLSGDVGADLFAGWRVPTQARIYASAWFAPPSLPGLVSADSQSAANLIITVPDDHTVFASEPLDATTAKGQRVALADPTAILWDLNALGGEDRLEAMAVVRRRLGFDD